MDRATRKRLHDLNRAYVRGELPEQGGEKPRTWWCPNCTSDRGTPITDPATKLPITLDGLPADQCVCGGRRMVRLARDGKVVPLGR